MSSLNDCLEGSTVNTKLTTYSATIYVVVLHFQHAIDYIAFMQNMRMALCTICQVHHIDEGNA